MSSRIADPLSLFDTFNRGDGANETGDSLPIMDFGPHPLLSHETAPPSSLDDIAIANKSSNTMSVLLNNGNGTFANKVDYATGTNPPSVAAADLNGDGQSDLAVANFYSDTVSVLLNNGNGTFANKVDYATGDGPISVAAADLNGDGKPDLAVANYDSNTVSLLFNTCLPQ